MVTVPVHFDAFVHRCCRPWRLRRRRTRVPRRARAPRRRRLPTYVQYTSTYSQADNGSYQWCCWAHVRFASSYVRTRDVLLYHPQKKKKKKTDRGIVLLQRGEQLFACLPSCLLRVPLSGAVVGGRARRGQVVVVPVCACAGRQAGRQAGRIGYSAGRTQGATCRPSQRANEAADWRFGRLAAAMSASAKAFIVEQDGRAAHWSCRLIAAVAEMRVPSSVACAKQEGGAGKREARATTSE